MEQSSHDPPIICIETKAFYALVEEVVQRLKSEDSSPKKKWINAVAAMELLGITSTTTLQKLRDEGKIRFTKPSRKVILYDLESVEAYLDKHAKDTF